MTQLRELENNHHETVTEIGIQLLERFSKNQADDIEDDLRPVSYQIPIHNTILLPGNV